MIPASIAANGILEDKGTRGFHTNSPSVINSISAMPTFTEGSKASTTTKTADAA